MTPNKAFVIYLSCLLITYIIFNLIILKSQQRVEKTTNDLKIITEYEQKEYRTEDFNISTHWDIEKIYTKEEVKQLIVEKAKEYEVDEQVALDIARCESSYIYNVKNSNSSASGVYQFINKTWQNYCKGDVMDPNRNIECFMKQFKKHPTWWDASKHCWSK